MMHPLAMVQLMKRAEGIASSMPATVPTALASLFGLLRSTAVLELADTPRAALDLYESTGAAHDLPPALLAAVTHAAIEAGSTPGDGLRHAITVAAPQLAELRAKNGGDLAAALSDYARTTYGEAGAADALAAVVAAYAAYIARWLPVELVELVEGMI